MSDTRSSPDIEALRAEVRHLRIDNARLRDEAFLRTATLAQRPPVPDGYVLMPREATRDMTMAACDYLPSCEHVFGHAGELLWNCYRKMVEVASVIPSTEQAPPPVSWLEAKAEVNAGWPDDGSYTDDPRLAASIPSPQQAGGK